MLKIVIVIEARKAALGDGMQVQRILPFRKQRMVGPFIFMDHGGPVTWTPEKKTSLDVLPHPHIGLSTVSLCQRTRSSLKTIPPPSLYRKRDLTGLQDR